MRRILLTVVGAALLAASCSSESSGGSRTVTLMTHESFVMAKPLRQAFERSTGMKLRIVQAGDAGSLLNQAILTKDHPIGDVLFGVDNTFLSRGLRHRVFEPFRAANLSAVPQALRPDDRHRVTPIDVSDVCINADRGWFEDHNLPVPVTLADLAEPRYRDLLVVENPATSSPGLAFLAGTVAQFGNDWPDYWQRLRENGVTVVDGWEQAYNGEFTGAAGSTGSKPLVVSYASSPPAEVFFADPQPAVAPTTVLVETCFRQIEFAGVLRNAKNPRGARLLVDFMLGSRFQESLPLSMFVFPAVSDTPLPQVFSDHTTVPTAPLTISPHQIARHRDEWITTWTDTVLG